VKKGMEIEEDGLTGLLEECIFDAVDSWLAGISEALIYIGG